MEYLGIQNAKQGFSGLTAGGRAKQMETGAGTVYFQGITLEINSLLPVSKHFYTRSAIKNIVSRPTKH